MSRIKTFTLGTIAFLAVSCGPKIKNDHSVGSEEIDTYRTLMSNITNDMKAKFGGNMTQRDKISPVESATEVTIGIPNSTEYTFAKDNSKFYKGDLNNDSKWDLIIKATYHEAYGPENFAYFVYLQGEKGYELYTELKADQMAWGFADKMNFKAGLFHLDSISRGALMGYSSYRKGDEAYYKDYSYRVNTEKFVINKMTKAIELKSQSELLKKNPKTDEFEKVSTESVDAK